MNLQMLMAATNWVGVETAFNTLYPHKTAHRADFAAVYYTLSDMTASSTPWSIWLQVIQDEYSDKQWVRVLGRETAPPITVTMDGLHKMELCDLSFTDWSEWLGMKIHTETLAQFSREIIAAHCLVEMTHYGWSQAAIDQRLINAYEGV